MSTVARKGHIESVAAEFIGQATEHGIGTGEKTTEAFARVIEAAGIADENYAEYFGDLASGAATSRREQLDRLAVIAVPLALAEGISSLESAGLVRSAGLQIEYALPRSTVDGPRFLRHELHDEYRVSLRANMYYGGGFERSERLIRVVESMKVRSLPALLLRKAVVLKRNITTLQSDPLRD